MLLLIIISPLARSTPGPKSGGGVPARRTARVGGGGVTGLGLYVRRRLNVSLQSMVLSSVCSAFQANGPAIEKACSANLV